MGKKEVKVENWECSEPRCNEQVLPEPDFSQPAQRYERHDSHGNLYYVIAHPYKELVRPAYCYFHKTFPEYKKGR